MFNFLAHCKYTQLSSYSLLINHRILSIPLPTHRLASSALRALQVDQELSPLVRRTFSLTTPEWSHTDKNQSEIEGSVNTKSKNESAIEPSATISEQDKNVLRVQYLATTNRMLRVAVNGFMESLGVVLDVMGELDVDILSEDL